MKTKKQELEVIQRRVKICRYQIVSIDEDVKAKIQAINSFSGQSTSLTQMCNAVRHRLNECDEIIKELEELSKGMPQSIDATKELSVAVKRYRSEVDSNLKSLRQASQRALKTVKFEERAALLSQSMGNGSELKQRSTKLSNQSAEFSDNLTNLLRTMDVQVKQSEETLKTLVGSSQVITETDCELRSMGSTIVSTGKLLSKFGRREMTDRILFVFALMFFFGVVLYIVKKRMFF